MSTNTKNIMKRILAGVMAASMAISLVPTLSYAAQSNEYVDPADVWIEANGRTNELDINATTTYETVYCPVCDMETTQLTYRVPEYTRSGETALNRGVMFSYGTLIDGSGTGNLDDGTPGVDAYYTGYHFTKSVCQNCGTINAVDGTDCYSFGKNVYSLNACDHNFFLDFDNTTYEPYSSKYHTTTLKAGEYCKFCKGTFARATEKQEVHSFDETIDGELGNQRFHITGECEDCGYIKNEYIAAKSVIQSYYGKADGQAHTVTISDLSESGVNTSIRYGTSASKCNLTSAPNYTDEGYYPVYYEITYSYSGESMTENGVSYVWLLADNSSDVTVSGTETPHVHDYRFLETVRPTCTELGYDCFQCSGCGALQKTNYVPATGHDYDTIVIREASCQQGGLELHMCKNCGSYYTESTSMTDHTYTTNIVSATCTMNGYTEHICIDCGYKYITDLTPLAKHDYREKVTSPTCTARGFTTYTCADCGDIYISDYTEPLGHDWDEGHTVTSSTCEGEGVIEYDCKRCDETMIAAISATGHTPGAAATCTEPQTCTVCGAILELPTGHSYTAEMTEPTCTTFGYTTYTCEYGDHTYIADYTDKTAHNYTAVVTAPTCTAMGYTTYACVDCGDTYVSDYTDKIPHDYEAVVTEPTCTTMGFTTYTCRNCGDTYVSDYTEELPHNYGKTDIAPTCTELGYSIYTCIDCGTEYIGDYKEVTEHNYVGVVTAPTCTEMGYTTYTCTDCGDTYIGDYVDPTGHDYEITVTEPACTELGYTTYTCKICGDTYRTDEVSAKGHTPSDWIIDIPATIENSGSKHIECTVCGEILETAEIPQLIDKDNSDEDGKSTVGDYSIILTDKDGKPVFDSEITIDVNDNINIKLPEGRLLDYEDRTTITVFHTENQTAASGLNIFIYDKNNNAATGQTDANGQLVVPNNQSSTSDDNGTIGGDNGETKYTYVVTVTNKNDMIISDCDIEIGENHDIVVKLPIGTAFNTDNRITVTVKDQNGEVQENINVIVIGDADYIEKGVTNANGQVTLPTKNQAYTDKNGTANVNGYIVLVEDETEPIYMALVTVDDNGVMVCLPDGKKIDYHNRTTVTVMKSDGEAVEGMSVNVYDNAGGDRTEITDKDGKVTIPPLNENIIDEPTPEPTPTQKPGLETPEPSEQPDETDEPSTTEKPDATEQPSETEKPKPTVNPDEGSEVITPDYSYKVSVNDNDGVISGAIVSVDKDNGSVTVKLPDEKSITPDNRIIVGVTDKDGKPVNGVPVTVIAEDGTEATDLTNSEGIAVVPPTNTDMTDKNGYAQVVEGENTYNVVVEDTAAKIENAAIEVKDGKISVILPDGNKLDTANQTTVTVTDKDNSPVQNMSVTVTDVNNQTAAKSTDENGKITVPVKTTGGSSSSSGGGSSSGGSSGGGGGSTVSTINVKVTDKDGKSVNVTKSTASDGITLTLPSGTTLDGSNYYTITVTDSKGNAKTEYSVTLKDKSGNSVSGETDANGQIIMPTTEHKAYIVGYEDGTFKPENNMTRAEAAAIFARNIAERKGENISSGKSSFTDVNSKLWYNNSIAYLEKYNIISGYNDGTFRPEEQITRAEFVTMCMRFYDMFEDITVSDKNIFNDVPKSHWASGYIYNAIAMKWIEGYADGTFKPDSNITRAEVVAIVNRVLDRAADTEYISKNISTVNKFTDLKDKSYWAFYEILEAANTHMAVQSANGETWVK